MPPAAAASVATEFAVESDLTLLASAGVAQVSAGRLHQAGIGVQNRPFCAVSAKGPGTMNNVDFTPLDRHNPVAYQERCGFYLGGAFSLISPGDFIHA
jgi:hypothetical protein